MTMTLKTNDHNFVARFDCTFEGTRYGFRHLCILIYYDLNDDTIDGSAHDKCCYYNRTWESYPYRTVMRKTVMRAIDERKQSIRADILREFNVNTLNNRGELFRKRCAKDRTIINLNEIYNKL